MPLQLPNLDDRTFDDLVQEAISLIPVYAPDWTNHNPTDPGITLIELFAYLSEILIYRLNRVTNANHQAFLNLLVGLDEKGRKKFPEQLDEVTLNEEIRKAVLQLRQCDRAVTCEDFERHAIAVELNGSQQVARARCIPRRNLEIEDLPGNELPGHISVVIVPTAQFSNLIVEQTVLLPAPELIQAVSDDLEQRRLLTTHVHVVAPRYVPIGVQLEIHLKRDALEQDVSGRVKDALKHFLHPLLGGTDGTGWEFGRSVFVSDIYQLLEVVPGVDYMTPVANQPELNLRDPQNLDQVIADSDRLLKNNQNTLVGIQLLDNELVNLVQNQLFFVSPIV
ncbi:MAG: baseplate J/gp47 family protein [Leptolyngbyaceae cyanobacterium bins.302]|nr:baseplate J/gp47 family protein [Leptolyngbyaceae cyanobacterium bins.302]